MTGLVGGLGFFLPLLSWLQVVGPDAWIGLSLLQAVFWLLLGAGLALVAHLPWWPLWAAGCWVLVETLRSVREESVFNVDTSGAVAAGIIAEKFEAFARREKS